MLNKIEKWHKTKQGYLVFAIVEAAFALLFAILAIDSGSLIKWTLTFVLGIGAVSNLGKLIAALLKKD